MLTKILLLAVLVAGIASPGTCSGDTVPPTNLELVEMAVRAAVDSISIGMPQPGESRLCLEMQSAGDAGWLLDNLLKERLLGLGWQVVSDQTASENQGDSVAAGLQLSIEVIELGLHYGQIWRRYLLTGKAVERIARVTLYYELVDKGTGDVLRASRASAELRDVVPASSLRTLADTKYDFARPELKKTTWDRYLEGGLVLAIIGVLVYLFYSNKTAS